MPKRLSKREFDDAVYSTWMNRMCTYGLVQAKKICWAAYVELRRQDRERKEKYGAKKKKTNRRV